MEEIILRNVKITRTRIAAAAVAASLAAVGAVGLAASSNAATANYTVTPKTGPGGTGSGGQPSSLAKVVTINGTGTAFRTAGGTSKVGAVTWQPSGTTCAVATNVLATSTYSIPTATQIVLSIPANTFALTATTSGGTTTYSKKDYTLCVFDTTSPTKVLAGTGKYTVYPTPTITGAVSPVKGPVTGGNTLAIDGTNFTAASVVKVGGVAATGVKVATDGKSLTAKVPSGTIGAAQVTVTTEGGTNPTPGTATWDDYTYSNAVSVTPESGDQSSTITINGKGFDALDFTASTTKIYLSVGAVDDTSLPGEVCGTVRVVSDSQVVCTLDGTVADGAYTVSVVADNTDDTTASVVSSSATFTVAAF
jgi:large repetitive protein